MGSRNPSGIYREARGSMEVTDECSNTGDIVGIEIQGVRSPLFCNGGMVLRTKREAPELVTSGFSPTTEDDRVFLGENSDRCFFEEDAEVLVAQFTNAHQVVMEVRHYVANIDGGLQE